MTHHKIKAWTLCEDTDVKHTTPRGINFLKFCEGTELEHVTPLTKCLAVIHLSQALGGHVVTSVNHMLGSDSPQSSSTRACSHIRESHDLPVDLQRSWYCFLSLSLFSLSLFSLYSTGKHITRGRGVDVVDFEVVRVVAAVVVCWDTNVSHTTRKDNHYCESMSRHKPKAWPLCEDTDEKHTTTCGINFPQ
jgi:hypothetical protein